VIHGEANNANSPRFLLNAKPHELTLLAIIVGSRRLPCRHYLPTWANAICHVSSKSWLMGHWSQHWRLTFVESCWHSSADASNNVGRQGDTTAIKGIEWKTEHLLTVAYFLSLQNIIFHSLFYVSCQATLSAISVGSCHSINAESPYMFFLAATLVGWIGGDIVYIKVAAKNIFLESL